MHKLVHNSSALSEILFRLQTLDLVQQVRKEDISEMEYHPGKFLSRPTRPDVRAVFEKVLPLLEYDHRLAMLKPDFEAHQDAVGGHDLCRSANVRIRT